MNGKTIMIDPGHGGTDSGAVGMLKGITYEEKEMNLLLALEVEKEALAQGFVVVLTRRTDKYVTLNERCNLENKTKPSCFISLHMDSIKGTAAATACGPTIWIHSKAPSSYATWAKNILSNLKEVGYKTNRSQEVNFGYRGNSSANYQVNADTNSPSMLIELGYISYEINLTDAIRFRQQYAKAIVRGICTFLNVPYTEKVSNPSDDTEALRLQLTSVTAERDAALEKLESIKTAGGW